MDLNENGHLTKEEFSRFLEKNDFFSTNKELELVMERFDRDRDGKVSYSEFFSEVAPKEGF
jgi:Ca2+-binding EF-hand superfamily protein